MSEQNYFDNVIPEEDKQRCKSEGPNQDRLDNKKNRVSATPGMVNSLQSKDAISLKN